MNNKQYTETNYTESGEVTKLRTAQAIGSVLLVSGLSCLLCCIKPNLHRIEKSFLLALNLQLCLMSSLCAIFRVGRRGEGGI